MEPHSLVGPLSPLDNPAPFWFLMTLKVVGFVLHAVPMNLWYAGAVLGAGLRAWGSPPAQAFATRLLQRMPTIMAFGVNFGIVPLLFLQVSYYRVFYAATVLTAWFWLAIIPLVLVAYACLYVQALGLKSERPLRGYETAAGWVSALSFLAVGFLFANGWSLMTHLEAWPELWQATEHGGAVLGTAANVADPTLWPRWLMMFGLALTTTATYVVVDSTFGRTQRDTESQRWLRTFAWRLYTCGLVWFAVMGSWYTWGTWSAELREYMFSSPWLALTVATAVSPGLPWLLIVAQRHGFRPGWAIAAAVAQVGVLGLNAVSRQVVQNWKLSRFYDVAGAPVEVQWSPMFAFLAVLLAGLTVILWMLTQVVSVERAAAKAERSDVS